jgi:hypothetical protein
VVALDAYSALISLALPVFAGLTVVAVAADVQQVQAHWQVAGELALAVVAEEGSWQAEPAVYSPASAIQEVVALQVG